MIEIGSETYYFDWDVFQYALIVVGLCLALMSVSRFKARFKILAQFPRLFLAFGVVSFLTGVAMTAARTEKNEPAPAPAKIPSFEEKIEQWAVCGVVADCIVVDKCIQVQAVNKKFEKEYIEELLKRPIVQARGCLKGEPDSRRAQYAPDCVQQRCKHIVVKPSTMQEVEDRLNGKFDP